VLPVDAQAARFAPIMWACVKAADMPLSLKLPEGFIPSYCKSLRAAGQAGVLGDVRRVLQERLPFADGDDAVIRLGEGQATGGKRQTPLKSSRSKRRDHLCSKSASFFGVGSRSQS
jgi:hypothetical protein